MSRAKQVLTCDCETDPFQHERVPKPFLWGLYDGKVFAHFDNTSDFVNAVFNRRIILYAHNGGKFDFMYLLKFVTETKAQIINGRIVSMMLGACELRDSFAAVPVGMGEIQKEAIEMWKLEENVRHLHKEEILFRNRTDCIYLYDLMKQYRQNAGTRTTIASNALSFSKKIGIDMGRTTGHFDEEFRQYYFGGRTQVFQPGTHTDLSVIDIRSSYPFAMLHDHWTGSERHATTSLDRLSPEQIQRSMITIRCTSHGAFPIKTLGANGGLNFPHKFDEFKITGWEYIVAKEFNLIEDERIMSVTYAEKTINFSDYVKYWFDYKQSHPKKIDIINYTIGKIMMNSLYGKASQNPAKYHDYMIVPGGTDLDRENGWTLYTEYDEHEIHRREALWKYKDMEDREGIEWKSRNLFFNVATAASITGFARAHLLRAIHTIGIENVIYSDTDSIVCKSSVDLTKLDMTSAIGAWELETEHAPIGHFAGKKLYGIRTLDGSTKIASKGSKLNFDQIARIVNGETITWENPAPSFKIDGSAKFVKRQIRSTIKA